MVEILNKFPAATTAQVAATTGAATFPVDLQPAAAAQLGSPVALTLAQAMAVMANNFSAVDGLVALAGGAKAGATPLTATINRVATVASGNDSVLLPASAAGMAVLVVNGAGANSMQVYGAGTDTINDVATGTGVAQAAGKSAVYFCPVAGKWYRVLSA